MKEKQKMGTLIGIFASGLAVLAVVLFIVASNNREKREAAEKEKEKAIEEQRILAEKNKAEFEKAFKAYPDPSACETAQELSQLKENTTVEFIEVPSGESVSIAIDGKTKTGVLSNDAWIMKKGSTLKTMDGVLTDYVLSNFENFRKESFEIIACPDTLYVKEWMAFFLNHEFDGKLNGWYPISTLEEFKELARLDDYVILNINCKPKLMAVNKKTNEIIPLTWSGHCWSSREQSMYRRGERFYSESLDLRNWNLEDNQPIEEVTVPHL